MFATIKEAIEEFKNGKMLIVIDDDDRENEGDFIMAAEAVRDQDINFMAMHGRGMICMTLNKQRCEELNLDLMVGRTENTALHGTAFTVTIDAKDGTDTGISARDRALTIRKVVDPNARPQDFVRPGHIFPLRAAEGGVLRRAGHTEAACDLARLASFSPAGVLCEIMNEDGTMARTPDLIKVAEKFGLKVVAIKDLIEFRRRTESLVFREVEVDFPTKFGRFKLIHFRNKVTQEHHLALVRGDVATDEPVLARVHSECLTGDVFGSMRCDCGEQLEASLMQIDAEGRGVLLYLKQEGRGIGLGNKLKAYRLQDEGLDTVEANEILGFPADLRDYGTGAMMLKDLGIKKLRIMTNNPRKVVALEGFDLEIVERVPIEMSPTSSNQNYLRTKRDKMGHFILKDE